MFDNRRARLTIARGNRGISLLEIVIGLVLVAILLTLTSVSLRSSIDKEGPRGLAYSLASDIRAARAEAQRSGRLVGVCFPSDNKRNSLSRSALLRKGDQRGDIHRILNYGDEYKATIFLGAWPGSSVASHEIPGSWTTSTDNEFSIIFRPDGSAFSNDIPSIEGNYPVVVASGYSGSFNGAGGTLNGAKNPFTVWVSGTGSVYVEENKLPVGTLSPTSTEGLNVAALNLSNEPSPTGPTVIDAKFLPEQIPGMPTANLGQNYVSIHPSQKEGDYLEYGMATIEIRAKDLDGGPLTYSLEASASAGDDGRFTVTNQEGQMRYVYDEGLRQYVWHALISWRPPAKAPADRVYDLTITLKDPEGNTEVIKSGAGLIPQVTSLPPARMVLCSTNKNLYLTNLDGANEIRITHNGQEENPFFSADGSRVFSFHDISTTERELRARPADGSISFESLASFSSTATDVFYDPTYTFAAIVAPNGTRRFHWGEYYTVTTTDSDGNSSTETHFRRGSHDQNVLKITIVNLLSNEPPILVSDTAVGGFQWSPDSRYTFRFENFVPTPLGPHLSPDPGGPYHERQGNKNGVTRAWGAKRLEGYPPQLVDVPDFSSGASEHIYNPAKPIWYVHIEDPDDNPSTPNTLVLKNKTDNTFSRTIATGVFENDLQKRKIPSWSADGERLAYLTDPGSGSKIVTVRVLNSSFSPLSSFSPDFELSEPNLSMPQLSPTGRWVYYLRGNKLFRALNASGSTGVDISSHIGGMQGYVISP